jgi:hypothetical protein
MRRAAVGGAATASSYVATSFIAVGSVPASTGLIRVPYNSSIIVGKDNGGTDRVHMSYGVGGTNELDIGSGTGVLKLIGANSATDAIYLYSLGTPVCLFGTGIMDTRVPEWRFVSTTAALIRHQNAANSSANPLTLRAQGSTGAGNPGSDLRLQPGRPGAGGTAGVGRLQGNDDDSTFRDALVWSTSGSAATVKLYGGTPIAQQTDVGAAPTDTVANLAAWAETLRTRVRNIGITA